MFNILVTWLVILGSITTVACVAVVIYLLIDNINVNVK